MRARQYTIPFATLLCAGLLPMAGCGPAAKAIIDKNREAAERKLEHLHAAVNQVRQGPPIEQDSSAGDDIAPVFDSGTYDAKDVSNARVLFEANCQPASATVDDLEDSKVGYRNEWWALPERALHLSEAAQKRASADRLSHLLQGLNRVRYVLIVRQLSLEKPEVNDALNVTGFFSFRKGTFTGEAHLFDLDQSKRLCAFRFTAYNRDQPVMLVDESKDEFLMRDLLSEADRTAQVELGKWAPKRITPWK